MWRTIQKHHHCYQDLKFSFTLFYQFIDLFSFLQIVRLFPAGICLLKVNNKNIRTGCEIRLKLTIKLSERRQWRHSGVFIVNFEHISHLALVFLLLTVNM